MWKYQHTFRVQVPMTAVAEFHLQSASMGAITPPPVLVQLNHAPDRFGEQDEMDFTLWVGPLPIRWVARIEKVTPAGFTDRQVRGPFRQWVHHHRFVPVDQMTTQVVDEVQAEPQAHLFWKLVGLGMWLSLPLVFTYRAWKTRRLLEQLKFDSY